MDVLVGMTVRFANTFIDRKVYIDNVTCRVVRDTITVTGMLALKRVIFPVIF